MAEKRHDEGEPTKAVKSTLSIIKKRAPSKAGSLKRGEESPLADAASEGSGSSLVIKRQSEYDKMAKGPKYQNTYRLDSKKPFKSHEVYSILQSVVLREVQEYPHYDPLGASKLIQTIATDVRSSVRALNYDRYKICVLVYLGEKRLQGFQCAFRALWDHERDAWTSFFYQTRTYFLSCTCYGLYHD